MTLQQFKLYSTDSNRPNNEICKRLCVMGNYTKKVKE